MYLKFMYLGMKKMKQNEASPMSDKRNAAIQPQTNLEKTTFFICRKYF